jgi:hypothetical protein
MSSAVLTAASGSPPQLSANSASIGNGGLVVAGGSTVKGGSEVGSLLVDGAAQVVSSLVVGTTSATSGNNLTLEPTGQGGVITAKSGGLAASLEFQLGNNVIISQLPIQAPAFWSINIQFVSDGIGAYTFPESGAGSVPLLNALYTGHYYILPTLANSTVYGAGTIVGYLGTVGSRVPTWNAVNTTGTATTTFVNNGTEAIQLALTGLTGVTSYRFIMTVLNPYTNL